MGSNLGVYPDPLHPPYLNNMHEALQIEIEKEQTRGEVILSEIARMHNLMTAMELALPIGGDSFPFGLSQHTNNIDSPSGTRLEHMSPAEIINMGVEEMKRLYRMCGSGDFNTPVLTPNKGNKIKECNVQAKPGDDVSRAKSEVSLPAIDQKLDGKCSCDLCHVSMPNERSLNEHLRGKKHRRKLQIEETINLSSLKGVETSIESAPLVKTEASLMEWDLSPVQENLIVDHLKEDKCAVQEFEWSCALCQFTSPNEQALNEHLQRKKHKVMESALRVDGEGKNCGMELSPGKSTIYAPTDPCTDEAMKCGLEPLLPNTEEASVKKHDLPLFPENMNSDDLRKNQFTFDQKAKWNCDLCKIVATNEYSLKEHLQGKKHKSKEAGSNMFLVAVTKPEQDIEATDSRMDQGVNFTLKPLLHMKTEKTFLNECDQSLLLENMDKGDLKRTQISFDQSVESSQFIATSGRALHEHVEGTEHKSMEEGRSSSIGPSIKAPKSVQVVGTGHPSTEERIKFTPKPILLKKTGEVSLEEQKLLVLENNLNRDDAEKNNSMLVQKVEWSCTLCEVFTPNEQELNEHLKGKKHKLREAAVIAGEAENNCCIELSPLETASLVQVSESREMSMAERMEFTTQSLLLKKTVEAKLEFPLQEKLSSGDLTKSSCALSQKLDWTCSLCQISAPNERALNEHLKGKKHNLKAAILRCEENEKYNGVELPTMTVTNSVNVAGISDLNEDSAEFFSESFEKTVEPSLKEQRLPPLPDDLKLEELKKHHSTVPHKMEWSCALCQITAPNEKALNDHLQGKKHKLKEASLIAEGAGSNFGMELPPSIAPIEEALKENLQGKKHKLKEIALRVEETGDNSSIDISSQASDLVQGAETVDISMEETEMSTSESWLFKQTVSSNLKEMDMFPLQEKLISGDMAKISCALNQMLEQSCSPCQIVAPDPRALNNHLMGRKHDLKLAVLSEVYGNHCCVELPPVTVKNSGHTAGTIDLNEARDKLLSETILFEKTTKSSLGEQNHPSLLDDQKVEDLINYQCSFEPKVEWSCGLCQITATSEKNLNDHLQGKKHKLKETALRTEGARKCSGMGLSPRTATTCSAMETVDPCTCGGVKFTAEPVLPIKTGEATSMEQDLPQFPENMKSDDLKKIQSSSDQTLKWNCHLCKVVAPNECALIEHWQGKKHKLKEAGVSSVTATKPPLLLNMNTDVKTNQVTLAHHMEWSCSPCQVTAPNKRVLDEPMQGKKHNLKDLEVSSGEPFLITDAKPDHIAGMINPITEEGIKLKDDPLLLKKSLGTTLEEPGMHMLQENLDSNVLKKVEWSCGLCEFVANNERALNVHLHGEKHGLGETATSCSIESSTMAMNSVHDAGRIDVIMEERVKFTGESLVLQKTGEVNSKEKNMALLQGKVNSDPLMKNLCASSPKLEWNCVLCGIVAPNERALDEHHKGRKHNSKVAALRAEGDGKNSIIGLPASTVSNSNHVVKPIDLDGKDVKPLVCEITGEARLKERSRPPLQYDLKPENSNNNQLSQVTADVRDLNDQLCGKESELKKDALNDKATGKSYKTVYIPVKAAKPAQADGSMATSTDVGVQHTDETLLLMNTKQTRSALAPLLDNSNSDVLKEKQSPISVENAKWCSSLCQTIAPNERVPNERLQGMKHKLNEADSSTAGTTYSPLKDEMVSASKSLLENIDSLPPLQANLDSGDLNQHKSSLAHNVEWRCALCQITASSERSLNEHLHGKKHKSREAELVTEGSEKNPTSMSAAKSVQAVGIMDQSVDRRPSFLSDGSFLPRNIRDPEDLPPCDDNQNSDDFNDAAFSQEMDWSCALCQVLAPNEKALNEHMQGKKHRLKDESLRSKGARKIYIIKSTGKVATNSVDVKSVVPSSEKGTNSTVKPFQPKTTSEARSRGLDVQPFPVSPNSNNLNESKSMGARKIYVVKSTGKVATNSDDGGAVHPSAENGTTITVERSQPTMTSEASSRGFDVQPFPVSPNSNNLNESKSTGARKIYVAKSTGKVAANYDDGRSVVPSSEKGTTFTDECSQPKMNSEASSRGLDVQPFLVGPNSNNLNESKSMGARKMYVVKSTGKVATNSDDGRSVATSSENGTTFTVECSQPKMTSEASSKGLDVQPFPDSLKTLNENESAFDPNVQKNVNPRQEKYTYWCELCNVGTLCETAMRGHEKGKKHIKQLSKSDRKCEASNPNPEETTMATECVAECGKNITSKHIGKMLQVTRSEVDDLMPVPVKDTVRLYGSKSKKMVWQMTGQ
ncbi:uncharacterized protein LOC127263516 [Andrographis paniculata]|uniref:uncharacterized protein LOC127263516 n=1 Tax=Andrographis paniculata TaxID=175694 RepID=UPI0021E82463|nr:uncharacterized protein LOC127263516 [Andrographis paniculata]XP_051148543.1 uncharacterized protein LOC127263516 [Andrographis paniculata]XP_051148544.1 uncharacterized protein LOC127263516 [Andrographis paniculata]